MRKQVRETSKAAYKYIRTTGCTTSQYVRIVGLLKRFKNGMTIAELHAKNRIPEVLYIGSYSRVSRGEDS